MKSVLMASSHPPPAATPFTAAKMGLSIERTRKCIRSKSPCWRVHCSGLIPRRSLRSASAEKARSPAPVRMMARTRRSSATSARTSIMRVARWVVMALSTWGRFRVMRATRPSCSRSTWTGSSPATSVTA